LRTRLESFCENAERQLSQLRKLFRIAQPQCKNHNQREQLCLVHTPGPEEVFVVSGVFNDGINDYTAGTFIHNPAGSTHVPQSKDGCVLFVFFPEG
jgi:hypothetical protein